MPDSAVFENTYKGKLASLSGDALAEAIRAYEALGETGGRMMSYAGLIYAGDSQIRRMPKFYGDVQERLPTLPATVFSSSWN